MADLGDSLPVGRIVAPPIVQRVHVEILPIQVDALPGEQRIDMLDEPTPGCRDAEIQESTLFAAKDPLGMVFREPGCRRDAFGLEPDDQFHSFGVNVSWRLP